MPAPNASGVIHIYIVVIWLGSNPLDGPTNVDRTISVSARQARPVEGHSSASRDLRASRRPAIIPRTGDSDVRRFQPDARELMNSRFRWRA